MERILTAVDGSAQSLKAAALAGDLAGRYAAELMLVTITRPLSPALTAELETYVRREQIDVPLTELASSQAETALADARLAAQAKGATRVSTRAPAGDPAEEIIGLAREWGADLIVVGSRGHGRLVGLLLGSVAQKILTHASCPVLVVR